MKNILKLTFASIAFLSLSTACSDGYIDDITEVAAGEDKAAPVINIVSPNVAKTLIHPKENTMNAVLEYTVSDDIEIAQIDVYLDGQKISSHTSFLDYRNYKESLSKSLGLGNHIIKIDAKDTSGKTSSKIFNFNITNIYTPLFDGEKAYFAFFSGTNSRFTEYLSANDPTVVGTPSTIAAGKSGAAFQGASNSYLSYPLTGLYSTNGISFTFWYKVNAAPDRAGIITINDNTNNSDENRNQGLRIFREGNGTTQRIKMNLGVGGAESWNDGGEITVAANTWVHVAVTVSPTQSKIYFNGVLKNTATYSTPFDFSTSTNMVIGSGAPSFTYWNHLSDLSQIDEVRVYNKALIESEIQATMQ